MLYYVNCNSNFVVVVKVLITNIFAVRARHCSLVYVVILFVAITLTKRHCTIDIPTSILLLQQ